jgi:hypothetical protein
MSIIDSKNFAKGGMDTDSAFELIAPNDYVEAYNVRSNGDTLNEEGYIVAIESNTLISLVLPDGLNKCIGANKFEVERKIYKFIFNSFGNHTITELDYDTNTEEIIFTNKTDSGGEDVLLLNTDSYVTDIKLLNGILYFINSDDQPCNISIAKLKDGSYGVVTLNDFLLIKKQPTTIPSVVYASDPTRQSNTLYSRLFQFRTQYVYDNNETSAWGAISDRPVPINEVVRAVSTNPTDNNVLVISTVIDDERIVSLNVCFRIGNDDWFYVKELDLSYIESLSSQAIVVNGLVSPNRQESYDPNTKTYSFSFYNNGSYASVDVLETDLQYDHVPNKSESMEIVGGRGDLNANSSVLCLAGNTEGYARPTVDKTFATTSYQPDVFIAEDPNSYLQVKVENVPVPESFLGSKNRYTVTFRFFGTPVINDNIKLAIAYEANRTIKYQLADFTVDALTNTLETAVKAIAKQVASAPGPDGRNAVMEVTDFLNTDGSRSIRMRTLADDQYGLANGFNGDVPIVDLAAPGTTQSRSVNTLKSNSSYQLALAFYDEHGRTFPIATDETYIVNTPSYPSTNGQAPAINWELTGTPPEGAHTYQWLLTNNRTQLTTLYMDAKYEPTWSSANNFYTFNLNPLRKFNENNKTSILNYQFTPGDKVLFSYYIDEGEKIYFNGDTAPIIDVEVVGFDPAFAPDPLLPLVTNYALFVTIPSALTSTSPFPLSNIVDKDILMEIYTPLAAPTDSEGTVFFEVGEKYPVVDGEYSVKTGQIRKGDAYYKTRQLNLATDLNDNETFFVESFNFSDFYASAFTPYGRPRSYFDTPEDVEFKASIRYSYEFTPKTRTNQINRFYGENVVTYDENFGFIRRIRQRDNVLITIQELKVGYVPIKVSIIEDQIAQQNIAVSTEFLNKIRYAGGTNIGIGDAKESFAEFDGTMYFVDPYRSEPVQISMNGVNSIAVKMSKFFRNTINEVYKNKTKLIGYYNIFNREYILTYEDLYSVINQLTFDVNNWQTQNTNTVDYDTLAIETEPTKGTVTIDTEVGTALYSPTLDELGSDTFSFSFTQLGGGDPIEKNVCITIGAGNSDVDPFFFGDLTGQPVSTLIVSNEVSANGVDVPVAISIVSGEYKIDDGAFTSTAGYIYPGQLVVVRVTSSATELTDTSCTLTMGDKSDTFTVTTMSLDERLLLVVDLISGQENDTYVGTEDSVEFAYTGNNFIPPGGSGDPPTCDILASDFINIFGSALSWRFVVNIGKYIVDNPLATEVVFQVRGKTALTSTSTGFFRYGTYGGTSTMDMTGTAGSYIPTILTPETLDDIREFTTSVYGGADGTFDGTLPLIATFTYDVATKITTVTLGDIPYIDYSYTEVNSGDGTFRVNVNGDVVVETGVTTPTTRLYLTDGDEVIVSLAPITGTPTLDVDDSGSAVVINTEGISLVSDPITVISTTQITAIGETSTPAASTTLEYLVGAYTATNGTIYMQRNAGFVHPPITGDIALTSISINAGDSLYMYNTGATGPSLIALYTNGVYISSSYNASGNVAIGPITALEGNTYRFEFSGPV